MSDLWNGVAATKAKEILIIPLTAWNGSAMMRHKRTRGKGMKEELTKASQAADILWRDLADAVAVASRTELLVIVPIHERACILANDINRLLAAHNADAAEGGK